MHRIKWFVLCSIWQMVVGVILAGAAAAMPWTIHIHVPINRNRLAVTFWRRRLLNCSAKNESDGRNREINRALSNLLVHNPSIESTVQGYGCSHIHSLEAFHHATNKYTYAPQTVVLSHGRRLSDEYQKTLHTPCCSKADKISICEPGKLPMDRYGASHGRSCGPVVLENTFLCSEIFDVRYYFTIR